MNTLILPIAYLFLGITNLLFGYGIFRWETNLASPTKPSDLATKKYLKIAGYCFLLAFIIKVVFN